MIDYHKVCWYCGEATMEPVETWYKCKSCEATYVETVKTVNYDTIETERTFYEARESKTYRAYKPSESIAREAAKTRVKKAATPIET